MTLLVSSLMITVPTGTLIRVSIASLPCIFLAIPFCPDGALYKRLYFKSKRVESDVVASKITLPPFPPSPPAGPPLGT